MADQLFEQCDETDPEHLCSTVEAWKKCRHCLRLLQAQLNKSMPCTKDIRDDARWDLMYATCLLSKLRGTWMGSSARTQSFCAAFCWPGQGQVPRVCKRESWGFPMPEAAQQSHCCFKNVLQCHTTCVWHGFECYSATPLAFDMGLSCGKLELTSRKWGLLFWFHACVGLLFFHACLFARSTCQLSIPLPQSCERSLLFAPCLHWRKSVGAQGWPKKLGAHVFSNLWDHDLDENQWLSGIRH